MYPHFQTSLQLIHATENTNSQKNHGHTNNVPFHPDITQSNGPPGIKRVLEIKMEVWTSFGRRLGTYSLMPGSKIFERRHDKTEGFRDQKLRKLDPVNDPRTRSRPWINILRMI